MQYWQLYIIGYTDKDIVFNNDEEILEYLNENDSMNEMGKENLSIIDTIHIDDSKIVILLSDTVQGYIVCEKRITILESRYRVKWSWSNWFFS